MLAPLNRGCETHVTNVHPWQSLTLSDRQFSGGKEYFSHQSEIPVKGKISTGISLGEQEECVKVIYFKVIILRNEKPFFCFKCVCTIGANILVFVTCINILIHLWFLHAKNNVIILNVSKAEDFF